MKQISEKYPKAWRDFEGWLVDTYELEMNFELTLRTSDLKCAFGYLVLEFFPKYRIEICNRSPYEEWWVWVKKARELPLEKIAEYETPQEAIEKAFQILESQEE